MQRETLTKAPGADEMEEVNIGTEQAPKMVRVGKNLEPELKNQLVDILRANIRTFAYSYEEMPGIAPEVACHKLNIDPAISPRKQK